MALLVVLAVAVILQERLAQVQQIKVSLVEAEAVLLPQVQVEAVLELQDKQPLTIILAVLVVLVLVHLLQEQQ
jgi:hypothetical protein